MEKFPPWKYNSLGLSQIESKNTPFNWFPQNLKEKDLNLLSQFGIKLPLLVQEVIGSKYLLVDGFKRFYIYKSCLELSSQGKKNKQFPCLVIPESLPFREVVKVRLETLPISGINLSGFRVSSLFKILNKNGFSNDEILNEILPRLGIKSSPRLVNQMMKLHKIISGLEQGEGGAFADSLKKLGCEDLAALHKFSQKDIITISAFVGKMQISGNKWRQLLQLFDEVSRMREISVTEILEMCEFKEILTNKNLQTPVLYRLIKQKLFLWRYPELNDLKKKFVKRLDRLELPKRISLECDPFFEDEDFILTLKMNSFQELRNHIKFLYKMVSKKTNLNKEKFWKDLFALMDEV